MLTFTGDEFKLYSISLDYWIILLKYFFYNYVWKS